MILLIAEGIIFASKTVINIPTERKQYEEHLDSGVIIREEYAAEKSY